MTYGYDTFDRRVKKSVDDDGNGTIDRTERYVYDFTNKTDGTTDVSLDDVVLTFDGSGALTHRYLHGADIDELFADETATGAVLWALDDEQGTIRDWAEYNSGTNTTTVTDHLKYDSYGRITAQSNSAHTVVYAFTGREWDKDVDLQYNRMRWYDPVVGRWISEDPIGFAGGDANLVRYVGNNPVNWEAPSGLAPLDEGNLDIQDLKKHRRLVPWPLHPKRNDQLENAGVEVIPKDKIPSPPEPVGPRGPTGIGCAGGRSKTGVMRDDQLIGPTGCGPCVGVILIPEDPKEPTIVIHIAANDDEHEAIRNAIDRSGATVETTVETHYWMGPGPSGGVTTVYRRTMPYQAVLIGGGPGGEETLYNVLNTLQFYGIRKKQYIQSSSIYVNKDGDLFLDKDGRNSNPDT